MVIAAPFRLRRHPSGESQRPLSRYGPSLSLKPSAACRHSGWLSPPMAEASSLRLAFAAGLFHPALRPGVTREVGRTSHRPVCVSASVPGALHTGSFSQPRGEGAPPSGPFEPSVPPDPPFQKLTLPVRADRLVPLEGRTLPPENRIPYYPFGQRWNRRLSALLQPGTLPNRFPVSRLLAEPSSGSCPGDFQTFID